MADVPPELVHAFSQPVLSDARTHDLDVDCWCCPTIDGETVLHHVPPRCEHEVLAFTRGKSPRAYWPGCTACGYPTLAPRELP